MEHQRPTPLFRHLTEESPQEPLQFPGFCYLLRCRDFNVGHDVFNP